MGNMIITINRENGSGGREIARRLGEMLGLKVYDKSILEEIVQKYKLNKEEIERIKAQKTNLWSDFCQFYRQFSAAGNSYQNEDRKITSRELYYAEAQIMRNLASQESCIIVGRSGFHVFKDNPDALSIFIIADREARIKRIAQKEGVDEKTAVKLIEKTDAARDNFTKTFAGTSRYDARNYDITLNVSRFSTEAIADFLAENIKRKMAAGM
ncbi:MAG: cytidylate kinase-like family protein [Bacteroidales bacterium]|nr:cytidylate kinase-like family protein [Bacteroidales bacterium]